MKKSLKKSIHVIAIALVFVVLVGNISFGAPDNQEISVKYAETDDEIAIAEERLNDILQLAIQKEIEELNSINESTLTNLTERNEFIDNKESTIETLENLQSIDDIVPSLTVNEAEDELFLNSDPINKEVLDLCQEIEDYKNSNPDQDTKEIIKYFNEKYGLEMRKEEVGFIDISVGNFVYAAFPYEDEWTSLTTQEKVLFVTFPADAILVKSAAEKANNWTVTKWGSSNIGDKSDGYRHATWNALMKRSSGNSMATLFATAHEDVPGDQLYDLGPDGYLLYKHAMMDLKNNEIGRGLVYASDVNVSDSTLKSRASAAMSTSTTSFYYAPVVSDISELPIVSGSKIVYMHN